MRRVVVFIALLVFVVIVAGSLPRVLISRLSAAITSPATALSTRQTEFDGDGRAELAVFRPANGTWYLRYSSLDYGVATAAAVQWGLPGDLPIAADFDGDGKTEFTVFRPANGTWYIRYSSLDYAIGPAVQWGLPGDLPIATDFDGDGKNDLTVFRPANGTWYSRYSSLGYAIGPAVQWGLPGDVPLAADFDGDGKTELTVFRPATGEWFILYSTQNYNIIGSGLYQWGLPGDVPLAGDFDGDGKTELAVFRPSNGTWYIRYSSFGFSTASYGVFQWGLPGDVPMAADFDGDGKCELAVYRPPTGEWFIRFSSGNADQVYQWGLPGDVVVKSNPDGNRAPTVAAVVASPGGTVIESVTDVSFTAQGVNDFDGDVLQYSWTSSDGAAIASQGPTATHTYGQSGVFEMRVTVTDPHGLSASATTQVVVGNLSGVWDVVNDAQPGRPTHYVVSLIQSGRALTGTMGPAGSRTVVLQPGFGVSSPRQAFFGVEGGAAYWTDHYPPGDDSYFDMTVGDTLTTMTGRCASAWTGFACLNTVPVTAVKR